MSSPIKFEHRELENQFNQREFVLKTIEQINKDLNGISTQILSIELIDKNSVYNKILNELQQIISSIVNKNPSMLPQFIYRVDIKESEFMAALNDSTHQNLAEKILIREAQKVFLRMKFS